MLESILPTWNSFFAKLTNQIVSSDRFGTSPINAWINFNRSKSYFLPVLAVQNERQPRNTATLKPENLMALDSERILREAVGAFGWESILCLACLYSLSRSHSLSLSLAHSFSLLFSVSLFQFFGSLSRICVLNLFFNGPSPADFSLFSSFQYTVYSKQMFNINK